MDEYFIVKKAVKIILSNLNDNFIKCLIIISIDDKYTYNIKLILGIIELVKHYMHTRKNDLLSSCIKYTNKSYYLSLSDSLFTLINNHLLNRNEPQEHKYIFINDLISKYNNPIIPKIPPSECDNNDLRQRLDSIVKRNSYELSKDTGTLFRDAYYNMKNKKLDNKYNEMKDIDLHNNDDLV
jgi:hypothetical protein